jgi:hypothetical protein
MVDVADKHGDIDEGGAPPGRARKFHQMPNLVVPQDFDASLLDAEYAAWEGTANHEQETA